MAFQKKVYSERLAGHLTSPMHMTSSHAETFTSELTKLFDTLSEFLFLGTASVNSAEVSRQQDIIHAVDLFFDMIVSSDRCSNAAGSLIARLKQPVLKAALNRSDFFSNEKNSARRLIKALYQASEKIEPFIRFEKSPLYIALFDIVERVVRDFDGDERIFLRAYFDVRQIS